MSKTIEINGVNNKYMLKKYIIKEKNINIKKKFFFDKCFDHNCQKDLLNCCYLNNTNDKEEKKKILYKELNKKLLSYINQDKRKNRYDKLKFISLEELLEKLVASQLKCFYCRNKIFLLYEKSREPYQWTLERLNNNIQHQIDNLEICCYKCNIQRKNQNSQNFQKGKQMILIKKE